MKCLLSLRISIRNIEYFVNYYNRMKKKSILVCKLLSAATGHVTQILKHSLTRIRVSIIVLLIPFHPDQTHKQEFLCAMNYCDFFAMIYSFFHSRFRLVQNANWLRSSLIIIVIGGAIDWCSAVLRTLQLLQRRTQIMLFFSTHATFILI